MVHVEAIRLLQLVPPPVCPGFLAPVLPRGLSMADGAPAPVVAVADGAVADDAPAPVPAGAAAAPAPADPGAAARAARLERVNALKVRQAALKAEQKELNKRMQAEASWEGERE